MQCRQLASLWKPQPAIQKTSMKPIADFKSSKDSVCRNSLGQCLIKMSCMDQPAVNEKWQSTSCRGTASKSRTQLTITAAVAALALAAHWQFSTAVLLIWFKSARAVVLTRASSRRDIDSDECLLCTLVLDDYHHFLLHCLVWCYVPAKKRF